MGYSDLVQPPKGTEEPLDLVGCRPVVESPAVEPLAGEHERVGLEVGEQQHARRDDAGIGGHQARERLGLERRPEADRLPSGCRAAQANDRPEPEDRAGSVHLTTGRLQDDLPAVGEGTRQLVPVVIEPLEALHIHPRPAQSPHERLHTRPANGGATSETSEEAC